MVFDVVDMNVGVIQITMHFVEFHNLFMNCVSCMYGCIWDHVCGFWLASYLGRD